MERKKLIPLLIAGAALVLAAVLLYSNATKDPYMAEKKLCDGLIKHVIDPKSYETIRDDGGIEEYYGKFSKEFKCEPFPDGEYPPNFPASNFSRYYMGAFELHGIETVDITSLTVTEAPPPDYRATGFVQYELFPNFRCEIKYTYTGKDGVKFPLEDKFMIGFFEGNIVYMTTNLEKFRTTGLMSIVPPNWPKK